MTKAELLIKDQDGAQHKSEEIWQNLLTAMIKEESDMFQPAHWSWLKKKLYPLTHEKVRDFIPKIETVEIVVHKARQDFLRSEIEKLELVKDDYPVDAQPTTKEYEMRINWANPVVHQAITSIITRYKEELKVLESK